MNAHASTENKTQQKKNDIYSGIELLLERIRNNKIKIVPGYINVKLKKRDHLDQLLVFTVYIT